MKKIFAFFVALLMCLAPKYSAIKPKPRLPHLDTIQMFDGKRDIRVYEEEKLNFINLSMAQVWNEDFGKFTELFYKHHFKLPIGKVREFEAMPFTEDTICAAEQLMKYLYLSPTKGFLDFFRSWIEFYKNFRCTAGKKGIILESLRDFTCRFLVEALKNSYMTSDFLIERTAIMCELYDLEDQKTLSL